mgnify:CR=1 FL=1
MGDVIVFQGYYYSANAFTAGTSTFVASDWTQLANKPTPQILPNWTNIATQFTDFYSLEVDSVDSAQQAMAQQIQADPEMGGTPPEQQNESTTFDKIKKIL